MKYLNKNADTKLLYQATWMVENTVTYHELTICPRAVLVAPEGKFVSLIVNGIGKEIEPGTYLGDVVLAVADSYHMEPHALMVQNDIDRDFEVAVVVGDHGAEVRVPELVNGGSVDGSVADGIYVGTSAQSYNGVVVTGDADYTIRNSQFDFEGFACNDFMGVGAGVAAIDKAKVTVEDSSFNFSGVTRCAVHAGGESTVTVNRCDITNFSPDTDWIGNFSWQIALCGSNRLVQLADGAKATYNDCNLLTNGWGITSIDGTTKPVELTLNRCKMRLVGPRAHGYGAFCIGENVVTIKDCDVEVNGYPMLVMGMKREGRPSIIGSKIRGRRFGTMVYGDDGSIYEIKDSTFTTGKSTLVVKGSNTLFNIDNATMTPGNGVVLQMMDNDECGMASGNFVVPVGEVDTPIEGRNLSVADPNEDVILNISNSKLNGSLMNSSTNLHNEKKSSTGSKGLFHDTIVGLGGMDDRADPSKMGGFPGAPAGMPAMGGAPGGMPAMGGAPGGMPPMGGAPGGMPPMGGAPAGMPAMGGAPGGMPPMGGAPGGMPPMGGAPGGDGAAMPAFSFKDNRGAKNLEVNLKNTEITGVISSAVAAYREGLTEVKHENSFELSAITQTPALPVNNGVILSMDASSRWTVTGTSYLTGLTIETGATIVGADGKTAVASANGKYIDLSASGSYTGIIVVDIRA